MASIFDRSADELLAIYCTSVCEIEQLMNDLLPKLYWAERIFDWRGNDDEADFFRRAADDAVHRLWHPRHVMKLARDELVRRNPSLWRNLAKSVEPNRARYQAPELYPVWKEIHGF